MVEVKNLNYIHENVGEPIAGANDNFEFVAIAQRILL